MSDKEAAQRTAAALGAAFGTRTPEVKSKVSRNKSTITRKNSYGMPVCMLSFNDAKAILAKEGKVFESDAELEKALWNGMKLRDGGSLRDSYASPTSLPTQYTP
jgi:formylglycine-generating enzyme required for sulfatase activity